MTPATTLNLKLRPFRPEVSSEFGWVVSSWLCSYIDTSRLVGRDGEFARMKRSVYIALYLPTVRDLIARSSIVVATLPDADDAILGWMAFEGDQLHYVHTKGKWRNLGVARFLLADLAAHAVKYTHQPPPKAPIPGAWSYDPDARFRKVAA